MIGTLGLITSVAGGIWGAYQSAKAGREAKNTLTADHNNQQNWYNARLAEDYTARPDFQSVLTKNRDLLQEAYKSARARAVVSGAGDEQAARMQERANDVVAQTLSNAAERSADYRDRVESAKMAEQANFAQQMANISNSQSVQSAKAGENLIKAGGSMIDAGIDGGDQSMNWLFGKKKKTNGAS